MSLSFLLQIEPTGAEQPTGVKEVPLWDVLAGNEELAQQGIGWSGWVILIILGGMLGYAVFIFAERYFALRKASREETGLLQKVKDYIMDGKIDAAKDFCSRSDSPSARMLEKGIARLGKRSEQIEASIENTGKLEILRLEQRLSFLGTAAGAAPMIGFLGTTVGMVGLFMELQTSTSLELKVIAPGIMTAMVTTVAGLIVGIISYIGYNYLVAKIGKVVYQMENDALEFMDLIDQPGK